MKVGEKYVCGNGSILVKVSRKVAHKLYSQKQDFIMVPEKMRPDSQFARHITRSSFERLADVDFDYICDNFSYYNCNSETGNKPAFYEILKK